MGACVPGHVRLRLGDRELMPRPGPRACRSAAALLWLAALPWLTGLGGCDASERNASERDASERDASERDTSERDASEGETPGTDQGSDGGVVLVDAAGIRHTLAEPARRIVSLVPSATETLRAIGAGDVLAGRTDYDTTAWTASIPSVGGGLDPNLEAVVALRPDAVIRFEGDQDPRTPERLDRLGIRHVAVRPVSLDGLYTTNRIVGRLTGHEAASDSLTREIRAGLRRLSDRVSELPRRRVAYMLGGSPPWVSGPGTYIDEIVVLVGGDNVFDDLRSPYASVSPEELRARDIDVVLLSSRGSYDRSLTPDARIEVVGDALEVAGPTVVDAAWDVAEAIHGRTLR